MNGETHEAARRLIDREHVEGLAPAEREWLESHLEACPDCARADAVTREALRSLRAVSVSLPPALAARTQLRVYLRSRDRHHGWALWAALAFSWAVGLASAPLVWQAFRWLGSAAGVPDLLWKTAFALWWAVPALLAAAVVLVHGWVERRSENVH